MTKARLLPTLFLAALLVAAQAVVVLHAFEHDPGAPPGKPCATCVAASQVAAGAVDTHPGDELEPCSHRCPAAAHPRFRSTHAATARQRGPPAPS